MINPTHEATFGDLIAMAGELSAKIRRLWVPAPDSLDPADRLLWALLRGLLRGELVTYQWILSILATPGAQAAEPLLRSLLDGFANVVWIVDGVGDPKGRSPQIRALCFELGTAAQGIEELDRLEKELGTERLPSASKGAAEFVRLLGGGEGVLAQTERAADLRPQLVERRQRVAERHAKTGCDCQGRRYNTSWILAKLAEKQAFLFATWQNLSSASHFFDGIGLGGDLEAVPSSLRPLRSMYLWRGMLLGVAVHALAESARNVRLVEVPNDDAGLATWAHDFRALPDYRLVVAGGFDQEVGSQAPFPNT